jgi:hypothetical protein
MYGKYRLSEFLMPKIATLVNIRFNSIQYFNGNSTVYWRDPINIKSGISHDKRHLVIT